MRPTISKADRAAFAMLAALRGVLSLAVFAYAILTVANAALAFDADAPQFWRVINTLAAIACAYLTMHLAIQHHRATKMLRTVKELTADLEASDQ